MSGMALHGRALLRWTWCAEYSGFNRILSFSVLQGTAYHDMRSPLRMAMLKASACHTFHLPDCLQPFVLPVEKANDVTLFGHEAG